MKRRWWNRIAAVAVCAVLGAAGLAGCGRTEEGGTGNPQGVEKDESGAGNTQGSDAGENGSAQGTPGTDETEVSGKERISVRVGSLKGPTSMGLLMLKEKAEAGELSNDYEFTMASAADELLPLMVKGDMDVALVPANVAAVLYQKTNGGVVAVDINTLGVLYMVSGNQEIGKAEDLREKTIYLTGKGTTPDYVLHYVLEGNGLNQEDYKLEYKSEASEVAALLAENPDGIGLLPQPFVTAACAQNEALSVVLDMNEEWDRLQGDGGSRLVTGVTVVRREFLKEHEDAVKAFMAEHKASAEAINADVEKGAQLAAAEGIVAKEAIAKKAIPECNITYIDGKEMKAALQGYLNVLFEQNADAVGGKLPEEAFYYIP